MYKKFGAAGIWAAIIRSLHFKFDDVTLVYQGIAAHADYFWQVHRKDSGTLKPIISVGLGLIL